MKQSPVTDEFLQLVNREIDGLLSEQERTHLQDVAAQIPAAAEARATLLEQSSALRATAAEPVRIPLGLSNRVLEGIAAAPPRRRFGWNPQHFTRFAAAVLIATFVALGVTTFDGAPVEAAPNAPGQHDIEERGDWRQLGVSDDRISTILAIRQRAHSQQQRIEGKLAGEARQAALAELDRETESRIRAILTAEERVRYDRRNGRPANPEPNPGR